MAAYRGARIGESGTTASCEIDRDYISENTGGVSVGSTIAALECEIGTLRGGQCVSSTNDQSSPCAAGGVNVTANTNPIDLISGIKVQNFSDFSTADGRFKFSRSYASRGSGNISGVLGDNELGRGWSLDQIPSLYLDKFLSRGTFYLPGHQAETLICNTHSSGNTSCFQDTVYRTGAGAERLRMDANSSVYDGGLFRSQDNVSVVDTGGIRYIFEVGEYQLTATKNIYKAVIRRIEHPGGYSINYNSVYDSHTQTNEKVDPHTGELVTYTATVGRPSYVVTSMTDSFGRTISFTYETENWELAQPQFYNPPSDAHDVDEDGIMKIAVGPDLLDREPSLGLVSSVNLPDGSLISYTYDSVSDWNKAWNVSVRLKTATRTADDGTVLMREHYHYEDHDFPFALTGITDTANIRYSSWTYDDFGMANSSEHAGGVDRVDLTYNYRGLSNAPVLDTVEAVNALGRVTNYQTAGNGRYFSSISGEPTPTCVGDVTQISNGGYHLEDRTSLNMVDRQGRQIDTDRNGRGWTIKKTVAA